MSLKLTERMSLKLTEEDVAKANRKIVIKADRNIAKTDTFDFSRPGWLYRPSRCECPIVR